MRLYIMRHGETAWNAQKKIQGVADIPLDGKGKELAKITGWALRDVDFDRVITSPLNRAKETARLVIGERKNSLAGRYENTGDLFWSYGGNAGVRKRSS